MVKQISISDELARELDIYRHKWGPGSRELSYSKTIQHFMKTTSEEDIQVELVAKCFSKLHFILPSTLKHQIENIKGLAIWMVTAEEEDVDQIIEAMNSTLSNIRKNAKMVSEAEAYAEKVR